MARSRWRRTRRGPSLSYITKEKRFHVGIVYEVMQWVFVIFASAFIAVALVYSLGIRTTMLGDSMAPSLTNGQEVLINQIAYQFSAPKRGDVIVFRPNGNENAHLSIKRVVAGPGDSVLITQGKVVINGMVYADDVAEETQNAGLAAEEIILGADEYFVLGDNRSNSEDSRSANIGNISRGMIEGKAWYHLRGKSVGMGLIE